MQLEFCLFLSLMSCPHGSTELWFALHHPFPFLHFFPDPVDPHWTFRLTIFREDSPTILSALMSSSTETFDLFQEITCRPNTSLHGNRVHVLNWHKQFMYIPGTLSNTFSNSKWGLEPIPWEIFFLNHFKIYQQDCRSEIKWPVFVRNFFCSWPEGNKY